MKLYSSAFKDNKIDLNYGKFADKHHTVNDLPLVSFDVQWELENTNSEYVHLIFVDFGAISAIGKPFVHWTVANLHKSEYSELKENASLQLRDKIAQGFNSMIGSENISEKQNLTNYQIVRDKNNWKDFNCFIGCMPPNKDHTYTLFAFSTKQKLDVDLAFSPDVLFDVLFNSNKVVEQAKLSALYPVKL